MEKPLVSVVMPVYNGERYIGKAIESALGQEVLVEVLVIDDCSADGTELAVMKYMDSGKIRYIRNEQNMGAARSRNRGVKEARGKYIAFLDAMLCGILVYAAVECYRRSKSILAILFPIAAFVLIGAEHCVADAFYLAAGISAENILYSLLWLAAVVAGNTAGAIILNAAVNCKIGGEK